MPLWKWRLMQRHLLVFNVIVLVFGVLGRGEAAKSWCF